MKSPMSRAEVALLAAVAALLLFACFGPAVGQPGDYHRFVDQRVLWGIPMAMDVWSNLPFALAGILGWMTLWRARPAVSNVQRAMVALFFMGLLLAAAGSAWYHLAPDEAGLSVDRCGMSVAFAGVLGLAAAGRISERTGAWLGLTVLLLGPVAARTALATANVLPWAVLQFAGLMLLVVLALRPGRFAALPVRWGLVVLAYAVAKLLELNDQAIFEFTAQAVSGHTLKHAVAALAAAPVIFAFGRTAKPRQNAAGITTTRPAARREAGPA